MPDTGIGPTLITGSLVKIIQVIVSSILWTHSCVFKPLQAHFMVLNGYVRFELCKSPLSGHYQDEQEKNSTMTHKC